MKRRYAMSKNTSNAIKGAVAFAATFGICYLSGVETAHWTTWHYIGGGACVIALFWYLLHVMKDK